MKTVRVRSRDCVHMSPVLALSRVRRKVIQRAVPLARRNLMNNCIADGSVFDRICARHGCDNRAQKAACGPTPLPPHVPAVDRPEAPSLRKVHRKKFPPPSEL